MESALLEVSFSCPLCSRLFVRDCPFEERQIPGHLDALLGTPCAGSGMELVSYLEIPDHAHPPDWPRFGDPAPPPVRRSR